MRRAVFPMVVAAIVGLGLGVAATWWWSASVADGAKALRTPERTVPAVSAVDTASPPPLPEGPSVERPAHSLVDPASPWVVVNKARPLEPDDYVPADLTSLTGPSGGSSQRMTPDAADDFLALYAALDGEGLPLRVTTAYRSYNFQSSIFNDYLNTWGRQRAETFSARPGYSEHQTGYAVDVYTTEQCRLKACFADTDTYAWLEANAADYGFIERYPEGSSDITGYRHEPWHWRWVGQDLALEMKSAGERTMEEFFHLAPAPDYLD